MIRKLQMLRLPFMKRNNWFELALGYLTATNSKHRRGYVNAKDMLRLKPGCLNSQIAGAGRDVKNGARLVRTKKSNSFLPPQYIEPTAKSVVKKIVTVCNAVK